MTGAGTSQIERFLSAHDLADYEALQTRAAADPEWFWRAVMDFHGLRFATPFHTLLDVSDGPQWPKWCVSGTTNLADNCLDRTLDAGFGPNPAIEWEGEDGSRRSMDFAELRGTVARAADGLKRLGIGRGDVVGLYLPSVPEAVAAYLAIVAIGAIALPMFSGYGAEALAERMADAEARAVVTADTTLRRGRSIDMAGVMREAAAAVPSVEHVVVVSRDGAPPAAGWTAWDELVAGPEEASFSPLPAETPAMIVYTSGTTGKPKGTVHTHCGFVTKVALDFGLVLDLQPGDRLLWMSDMGWLTGPILAVACPLIGATLVLAEGTPDYPGPGRLWELAERHGVTFLGVAPTMVRAFMQQPLDSLKARDLSALRVTASTGEPWTSDAWTWFREHVGGGRVPLLNYSGGTEIGGGILAGTVLHPDIAPCGFAGPVPGMGAAIVDEEGRQLSAGQVGELVLTVPSIGLTRGLWKDPDRYIESYWSRIPGLWVHGDYASIDEGGTWFVHGRSDDTIKVAGKRVGPSEIEALLLATGKVAEAAAIAVPHPVKGASVVCACVPASGVEAGPDVEAELKAAVAAGLGASFRPAGIAFVGDLPKTRTMKIMRRLVRSVWLGEPEGDLSGLVNPDAVVELRRRARESL